jgi:hypothetical protein
MSLPLAINDSLFFWHKGKVYGTWGLACGDGYTDDIRMGYLAWCEKHGCDGVLVCLNNEEYISLFSNGFMNSVDMIKYDTMMNYFRLLKSYGAKIAVAFYDGPAAPGGKYHPILDQPVPMHEAFIQAACQVLNPLVSAYVVGCETSRYWDSSTVTGAVAIIKKYAGLIPVGTHMVWKPDSYALPAGMAFLAYETLNHPKDGDKISVADMVREVQGILARLPPGFSLWVSEFNWNDSVRARDQAKAIAELPGVVGVGGPLR